MIEPFSGLASKGGRDFRRPNRVWGKCNCKILIELNVIDFQRLDYSEFETLVGLLLTKERYQIVRGPSRPGTIGPDFEVISPQKTPCFVEVKHFKRPLVGRSSLIQLAGDLERYRQQRPDARGLLVLSGSFNSDIISAIASQYDIEIWDGQVVLSMLQKHRDLEPMFETLISSKVSFEAHVQASLNIAGSRATDLSASLTSVPCGRDHWRKYERICTEILTYVFAPDLGAPDMQSRSDDGLDIIDAVFPIRSNQPPWSIVRSEYRSRFAVAEFKNYCDPIGQVQVESIAQYLWRPAQRHFGLLVSRYEPSHGAVAQRRRKWLEDEKCIVMLTDEDLLEMLQIRESSGQPFDIIDAQLEEFLRTLTP